MSRPLAASGGGGSWWTTLAQNATNESPSSASSPRAFRLGPEVAGLGVRRARLNSLTSLPQARRDLGVCWPCMFRPGRGASPCAGIRKSIRPRREPNRAAPTAPQPYKSTTPRRSSSASTHATIRAAGGRFAAIRYVHRCHPSLHEFGRRGRARPRRRRRRLGESFWPAPCQSSLRRRHPLRLLRRLRRLRVPTIRPESAPNPNRPVSSAPTSQVTRRPTVTLVSSAKPMAI